MLVAPQICPILLTSLLVYYDPVLAPPVYATQRAELLSTLNSLAPRVTLSALNGVLAFARPTNAIPAGGFTIADAQAGAGQPSRTPSKVDAEWYGSYPSYVPAQTSRFLTSQVLRPGGVRAVLENTLPVDAEGPAQSDATGTAKAQGVARVLAHAPPGVDRGIYMRHVLREAQVIFSPPFLQGLGNGTGVQANGQEGRASGDRRDSPVDGGTARRRHCADWHDGRAG